MQFISSTNLNNIEEHFEKLVQKLYNFYKVHQMEFTKAMQNLDFD